MASGHRPLHPQSLRGCVALSDGDHSVCSPFRPSGRLDGLHRSSGGVPAGSGSSGISSLPSLCLQWSRLPVQSAVLWPIHGSAGLLSGHGSCFHHSPLYGYPHAHVPGRLACPVLLSGISSQGSPGCPEPLPQAGHCRQPREVQPCSISGGPVSRGGDQRPVFCGFSVTRSHIQAALNRRGISILRLASRKCLAVSAGDAFLVGSPDPRGQTAHAVSNCASTSPGIVCTCRLLWLGPRMSSGCVSPPGVFRPRLLVRRLGCRVGCSSGSPCRFRPLVLRGVVSTHQHQRAACHQARSPPFSIVSMREDGRSFLRQRHSSGVSAQGRGNQVSLAQFHCSRDPSLVGVARHPSGSTVHSGLQQRPCGRFVSPSPASALRVVPQHDSFSVFESSVAGSNRFVCHLSKSPLFDIFLSLPRPPVSGHGRLPPVLGRSSGLCLSSIRHHSQSSGQTPGISGDGAHPCGSALGSTPLVSGPSPAVAGPSCGPPRSSRPPAPASVSAPLPGSAQATASCLETLRRFTKAAGFSSAVAEQASLARHSSSLANYQLKWTVYRSWCHSHGHSVSRPSLAKVADFLCWLRSARGLSVSSIRGYRSMLSAVFRFHLPSLSSDPVLRDLLRSFRLSSAERFCVLLRGTFLWF